jgi:hypothetical protein
MCIRDSNQVAAAREAAKVAAAAAKGGGPSGAGGAAAEREAAMATRERARASADLGAIQQASQLTILSGEARLNEEYKRQMLAISDLQQASGDREAADAARAAVREQREVELWEMRRDRARTEAAEQEALSKKVRDAEVQRLRERERAQQAFYGAVNGLATTSAGALLGYANQIADGNREAAQQAFNAYKAISIVQAVISGAAGAARAFADYPYPASIGIAAAVTAQAAIQVAVIASQQPTFADTPGIQRAGPQGMTAKFAPRDLVVAGRDEGDLVRQMQRAGIGGGGGSQVLIRDADRHHGRYGRDPMRSPDRYQPVRRRAGRIPGRR